MFGEPQCNVQPERFRESFIMIHAEKRALNMNIIPAPTGVAPTIPRIAVLACSVFESEIALHTAGARHIAEIRFFEIGLHDHPSVLRG